MADVMTDFNIRRGLSTVLFSEPGVINPDLLIEEGCWYLCTDTAELFLGVRKADGLTLKRINEKAGWDIDVEGTEIDAAVIIAMREEVKAIKENLKDYAKTSDIPSLEGYATEQYVLDAIEGHEALAAVEEVKTKLETEVLPLIPTVQENILPAVQKVETEILPTVQELAEKAATQEWVQEQKFVTEIFVTDRISEIEIPEIPTKVSDFENDAGYITLAEVPKVDLSVKADKVHYHDEYAQKEHNHDDLYEAKGAAEAIKNELLNGASNAFDTLKELGDLIETNKDALSVLESVAAGKADKEHGHGEYALKTALENLASKTDIPVSISQLTNDSGYITLSDLPEVEIPEVPTKVSELENDSNYATTEDVATAISQIKLPETDLTGFATKDEIKDFVTLSDVETHGYLKEQDLTGYAKSEDIPTDYLTEADLEGYSKFSGSYNDLTDKPEGLATESFVNDAIAKIELTPGKDGVDGQDGKNGITPHIGTNGNWFIGDDDTGVKAHGIDGTNGKDGQDGAPGEKGETGEQGPKGDAFTYEDFTKEQLEALRGEQGPAGKDGENGKDGKDFTFDMFTIEQLESLKVKGDPGQDGRDGIDGKDFTFDMFTEEQLDLLKGEQGPQGIQGEQGPRGADGKDGLTTSVKIGEVLYNHENGIIALPELAAEVPFTTAKLVNNPIGAFKVGDNLAGMSIAEILINLLGLSTSTENPDKPNNLSLYQITETGELVELPYVANIYTPSEATGLPAELKTGFYQVKDGDTVIESGYEHYTEQQAMYYMVALPSEYRFGENIEIKAWDNGLKSWNTVSASTFTCDYTKIEGALALANIAAPQVPDGYTLWADLSDINSGMQYRFIIIK